MCEGRNDNDNNEEFTVKTCHERMTNEERFNYVRRRRRKKEVAKGEKEGGGGGKEVHD